MARDYFSFKQFTVFQRLCAMKVGTDGVLLGAWTQVDDNDLVLDIGTGTGLIALMLAQKNNSIHINALDIDELAVEQATINVAASPFSSQIQVQQKSLQTYQSSLLFDLIVSNPPFFNKALHSPNLQRTLARHNDSLSVADLLSYSWKMLKVGGRLSLVYPFEMKDELLHQAKVLGYFVSRLTSVYPTPHIEPKRLLLELTKTENESSQELQTVVNDLVIEKERHVYTPEFKDLTHDYYLKH